MNVTRSIVLRVEMLRKLSYENTEIAHQRLKKVMGADVGVDATTVNGKTVFIFVTPHETTNAEIKRVVQSATQGLT